MKKLLVNKKTYFLIEPINNRVRLILYQNSEEWVCRKESIKKLEIFLQSKEARIFKGRLQLIKIRSKIHIEVKGEVIGSIGARIFEQLIPTPL